MIKKTLYFSNPAYLSCEKEQMVIEMPSITKAKTHPSIQQKGVLTRPIEDLGVIVLDNPQITLTHGLIDKLLANRTAIVTCSKNHLPFGLCLPLYGNTTQNERFRKQLTASLPLQKQLWQQTVQQKIRNQAEVLRRFTSEKATNLDAWAREVRSGDSTNLEARAAAYYWKTLFPEVEQFTREREGESPNNFLNYGYAILRALVARALVITGLLPTLGIHHHNKYNAYCLADDIMEPYRPYVDKLVIRLTRKYGYVKELDQKIKAELLAIPTLDVHINQQRTPLLVGVSQTTASLYQCFAGESRKIDYPLLQ